MIIQSSSFTVTITVSRIQEIKSSWISWKNKFYLDKLRQCTNAACPYMIHIPGQTQAESITYGGQVDALPTLLHLLGVDTKLYSVRTRSILERSWTACFFPWWWFVTPKYTYYGGTIYSNETGEAITEPTEEVQNEIDSLKEKLINS